MEQRSEIFADEVTTPKSFRQFYDRICDKIRASCILDEIMNEFEKFKTDLERVTYVAKMEDVRNLCIDTVELKNAERAQKLENEYDRLNATEEEASKARAVISKSIQATPSDDKESLAIRFMKRGWSSLLQERFDQALLDAQRSLSFEAPPNLVWNAYEILGHCYAKKNFNKKAESFFMQALEGLRNSDYPNEVKAKSTKRISLVLKSIKGRKDEKENKIKDNVPQIRRLPNVSYGPHEILESATSAVEVVETKGTGRGLYATREIHPGDVIIVEEPFVAVPSSECLDINCSNCFQRVDTPLPCPSCSSVWFCDEKCFNEGSGIHKNECKVLPLLYDPCIGKMALLVFRILQKVSWKRLKLLRDVNPESLPSNLLATKASPKEEKRGWLGQRKMYMTQDYLSTLHLVANENKRSFGDLFKRSLSAIYIARCLEVADFFGKDGTEEGILYIAGLALRHLQGSSCNAYAVTEYATEGVNLESAEGREIGGAIYPTISLTNHSCCPNTFRYSVGTTCVLRAMKTTDKGAEVFDNYGAQFQVTALKERQQMLQSQYKFHCECCACLDDWPLYPHNKEPLTFICPEPSCGKLCPYSGGSVKQCPHCGKSERYEDAIRNIETHLNDFRKGLSLLNKGNISKAIPLLLNHAAFLHKNFIRPPGKHVTDTQEALKRAFLAEASVVRIKQMG